MLAFVAGRMSGDEIDEHLVGCRSCRDLVVLAARTTFASGSPPQPISDDDSGPIPIIDRYTITGLVGAGGQALVYTAHDNVLGRTIALKILRDAKDAMVLDEARLAAKLSHPNIIAIHDAGAMRDGQLYLAMEYVAGGSLDQWLRKGRRSRSEIIRVCVDAGRGLSAAHGAGIVHRDIKAANILVGEDGRARVTDFGLATAEAGTHRIAGTLAYMAPEQLDGHATPASDQFSYAVTVWEALTGSLPFPPAADRAAAALAGPPANKLPRYLDRALRRALDPDPAKRYSGIGVLVNALMLDPNRLWRRLGVATVAAGAIATTAFVFAQHREATCANLDAPLRTIWNPATRTRVEAAFAASKKPFAPQMARGVLAHVDSYTSAWATARGAACTATAQGGQSAELLDLRNQCLDERSAALRATVDALATADERVVEHALELVRGLPPIAVCSDTAWLRERVRPPTDPVTRKRVTAIAEQLATSQALLRAGKLKEALTVADAAASAARLVDHAPTKARTELALGKARALLGETQAAEKHLQEAAQLAQRGRDDRVAAEAWIELVKVIGHGNARYDEALRYAGFAEATAARLGDDKALRATLDYYRCAIYELQAKLDAADAACMNAAKLRTELYGASSPDVADLLVLRARLAHKRSKPNEARELVTRAIAIREQALGKDHPSVMEALFTGGQLAMGAGNLDEAEAMFLRGMAIGRASSGEDSLVMAALYGEHAALLHVRGKLPEALEALDRGTAIRERVEGKDHPDLVFNLTERGRIFDDMGKLPEASEAYERALAIAEKSLGDKHPSVSAILQDLGRLHGKMKQPDVARKELDRAIEVAKAGEEPGAIASATSALAEFLHASKKPRDALPLYKTALETYEGLLGPDHPQLIATLENLALAHVDIHDPKSAVPLYERAIALEEKRTGAASAQLLMPLEGLGDAQLALGQWRAAKATWERALALDNVDQAFPDEAAALKKKLAPLR